MEFKDRENICLWKQTNKTTCTVLIMKISFFFSCWTNPFLRNVRHTIEFAEFPVKLDFDLDEVQPSVLCSQIFLEVNEMNTLWIYINAFGGFCTNSSFF